jgi:hypothetical protein
MSADAPKTPQEALNKAMILITNLRDALPCKVGKILICMDEIGSAWEEQDLEQFPFNLLHGEVDAISTSITIEYDDLNQIVDRTSYVYDRIISLEYRLRMSNEFIVASKVFDSVEKRFERIDVVLPVPTYAVRDLLSELDDDHIDSAIKRRFEAAVNWFERQEYELVLQECGKAGEALFDMYVAALTQYGYSERQNRMGPALNHLRRWLADGENKDKDDYSLAPSGRIEWFLLHLFEALHFLRNVASHQPKTREDLKLPLWQSKRRKLFRDKPEYARLSICLGLQIALELQNLFDRQGRSA